MTIIKRYLSEEMLEEFKSDFSNVIKIVNNSYGELELAIRDNYLNLYSRGNSIAKINWRKHHRWEVSIHCSFFNGTRADSLEFYDTKRESRQTVILSLSPEKPPLRFLQKVHLDQFAARVKEVNYGEEIAFEQALITDNMGREDLIVIDRQVTDPVLRRRRMDLLVLKQTEPGANRYGLMVIEIKLGRSAELKQKVAAQLEGYVAHLKAHFADYKMCYEKHYRQKKYLGVLDIPQFKQIEIVEQIEGLLAVGGYSKLGNQAIAELKQHASGIEVKQFVNKL